MKKILLIAAMVLGFAVAANAQSFRIGGRVGSGFQAQAEYLYNDSNYIEGRFGMAWYNGYGGFLTADFTVLHNWNVFNMDWTPSFGEWFFDAGVGLTVGGRAHLVNLGVAGCAKLGVQLNDVPLRLAFDWTPAIGPYIPYYPGGGAGALFNPFGFANLGISCVYCF